MGNLNLGTIGWSYNFWLGIFYPNKTVSKDYLAYYAQQFNTVEVDSTFYRIPTQQTVENWCAKTPDEFLFSLKFPQIITHVKALRGCWSETEVFLARAGLLGDKLGALLLQFPPSFTAKRLSDLADYLHKLPSGHRYVVEVRNKSLLTPKLYKVLRENNVALAWADSALMTDIDEVTADFLYIRWEGNRKIVSGTLGKKEVDRSKDLKIWADRLKPYLNENIDIFGYFGKYFSGYPPLDINGLSVFLD